MARRKKRDLTAAGISRESLELTPARALNLITGINQVPSVSAAMLEFGFTKAEGRRGFALIQVATEAAVDEGAIDAETASAIAACDAWDEPNFRIIAATLKKWPNLHAQVFEGGLAAVVGTKAVLNVATMLTRLTALEATDEGRAALEVLAVRKITPAERRRMDGVVKQASSGRLGQEEERTEEKYEQALLELREWFDEWSEIAKVVVRRRDHLIRLGLAERRTSGGDTDTDIDVVEDPTPFIDPTKDAT